MECGTIRPGAYRPPVCLSLSWQIESVGGIAGEIGHHLVLDRVLVVVAQREGKLDRDAIKRSSAAGTINPHAHRILAAWLGFGSGGNTHLEQAGEHAAELHNAICPRNPQLRARNK